MGEERGIGRHVDDVGIALDTRHVGSLIQGGLIMVPLLAVAMTGIFASKDTGTLSVVGVVAQAVTEEPRLVAVVVLIVEIDLQLLHTGLQEVEVPTLGVRPRGADEFQRGIFGTQGSIELLQALGKHRAVATMGLVVVPLLIAHTEVFQVEGRRMAHVGAYLTPFGIHRTVGKLYEVEGILDIRVEIV